MIGITIDEAASGTDLAHLLARCCIGNLAGSTFHHWVADHNTLWLNPTTEEAVSRTIKYYVLLGSVRHTPLPYLWLATAGVAVVTLIWRMAHHKGEKFTGGFLFDAGCCRESMDLHIEPDESFQC